MTPRRVIVTGGATNIGRAITEKFLAEGARVAVGQPDIAQANSLVEQYGNRVVALAVDVGVPGQCSHFIAAATEKLGGLDVLVNNAAITGPSACRFLGEIDPANFQRMLQVNLGGVLFCSQAAVPHLRKSGGGVILHISSINAMRPQRGAMVYAATKAAVSSLAQSMGKELAPDKIRVIAIAPGDIAVDQPQENSSARAAREAGTDVVGQTPWGQGTPADIAETAYFLCSSAAKFVTGTTWVVDGGLLA